MSDNDISLGIDEGREAKKKKNENQKKISCRDFSLAYYTTGFEKREKSIKFTLSCSNKDYAEI